MKSSPSFAAPRCSNFPQTPLCVALDDTILRKPGIRIPGVAWRRDATGPHFQTNFVRAQRFLQLSANVPLSEGNHRLVPIAFRHAPTPKETFSQSFRGGRCCLPQSFPPGRYPAPRLPTNQFATPSSRYRSGWCRAPSLPLWRWRLYQRHRAETSPAQYRLHLPATAKMPSCTSLRRSPTLPINAVPPSSLRRPSADTGAGAHR